MGGGSTRINRDLAALWSTPSLPKIQPVYCAMHTLGKFLFLKDNLTMF